MSDEQRKLTPTERLHDLALAAISKQPRTGSESLTVKQATVGDLKGRWVCDGLTIVRHPDEPLDDFNARWRAMLADVDVQLVQINSDTVRAKLEQDAAQTKGGAK